MAGVRAVVSTGWGGLDPDMIKAAGPNVFALGNVPHDWLFERVSAVCHHGGAGGFAFSSYGQSPVVYLTQRLGTTATGLKFGKPTIVVPSFGEQVMLGIWGVQWVLMFSFV